DSEDLRRGAVVDDELGAAAARITECVARQLGDGGRDAGLVLPLETEKLGESMRPLTYSDNIAFAFDRHSDDRPRLAATHNITSGRPAAYSRPGRRSGPGRAPPQSGSDAAPRCSDSGPTSNSTAAHQSGE